MTDSGQDHPHLPHPHLPRSPILAGWEGVAIGVGIGLVLALLTVLFLTQTAPGKDIVLDLTVGTLGGTLTGELEVRRIRGNLLRGATLYDLEIRDEDGALFFRADSAEVAYGTRSILLRRMFFRRLVLHNPTVELVRMPGDELWNFQHIFGVPDPDRDPQATLLDVVEIHGGAIRIRVPWEPDPEYSPERREEVIREALDPEGRSVIERAPGGFLQTTALRRVTGRFVDIQVAPDALGGTFAEAERFAGLIHIWRQPIDVRDLRGEMAIYDGKLEFRSPSVRLPDSDIAGYGLIEFGERVRVNVTLSSGDVMLRDLQWLYPPLPDEGGGQLELHIESRPEGVLYFARRVDLTAPGTRVTGRVGVLVNEALQFVEPDLTADPLRVETIESILPVQLPFADLRIRAARVEPTDEDGA